MNDVFLKHPPTANFTSRRLTPFMAGTLLVAVLAVGMAWRCHWIAARSLWYDEALSYFMSRYPLSHFLEELADRNHPPVYFLLLKAWTAVFGTSPLALRLPSLISGLLTIVGTYLFSVEALRAPTANDGIRPPPTPRAREIGLWAAAFVALSAFQIRWSWEVRMYALGSTFTVFMSWLLFRTLHTRSGRNALWLAYAVLGLLFAYTHYFGLLTMAAHGLFVFGYIVVETRRPVESPKTASNRDSFLRRLVHHPHFRPALMVALIICGGWLPWLPVLVDQRHSRIEMREWIPMPTWRAARTYAYHLLIEPEAFVAPRSAKTAFYCALVCVGIPLALLWRARSADSFVILSAVVPIVLSLFASTLLGMQVFYSRYFLFAQIFLLIGAAFLLGRSRFPWERLVVGGAMVLLLIWLDARYVRELGLQYYPSYPGVVKYVESRRKPGEPVVVCDRIYYLSNLYYADGVPGWYMFGTSPNLQDDAHMAMGAENVVRPEQLDAIPRGRVWVVNTTAANGRSIKVAVPKRWVIKTQTDFADRYGTGLRRFEVVEYEVPLAD
jgi:mannosyltransferase